MKNHKEYSPDIDREVRFELPDHQTLLTFTDDEHSYAFHDWWGLLGQKQFLEWVKTEIQLENRK